ncbi:MAG: hypothetical protein ACSHYF_11590 [Verrucomicrobiaceae bacterium]
MKKGVLLFVAGVATGVGVFTLMEVGEVKRGDEGVEVEKGRAVRVAERTEGGSRTVGRGGRGEARGDEDSGLGDLMGRVAFLRASAGNETNQLELGRLTAVIGAMSGEEVDAFLLELEGLEEDETMTDPLERLSEVAMLRLFELDGFAAIQALADDRYPNCDERFGADMRVSSMSVWAGQNPDGVRDWVMGVLKKLDGGGSMNGGELFLNDEEVMEAFFLNYERLRPGQSAGLAGELGDQGRQDLLGKLSMKARIKLAEDPGEVGKALDDSLGIAAYQAGAVLEEAMAKNLEVCRQWVEGQGESEHRNQALLDVGYEMISRDDEKGVGWLLEQEVTDVETRKRRLGLVQRQLQTLNVVITESRIEMPVFGSAGGGLIQLDVAPEVVEFDSFINYGTPIEVSLNNPQRSLESDPEAFVQGLREGAAGKFEGRFVGAVEEEIRALGLGE